MKIPVQTDQEQTQEDIINDTAQEETPLASEENEADGVVEQDVGDAAEDLDNLVELPVQDVDEDEEDEDELTVVKKQLAAKEQEAKDHYEARLRLQAEFDNFRKRKEKEIVDFRKYANEDFIKDLLVVVDDFDRAIAAAEQSHKLEDFLEGVEMIFEKFLGTLKKKGISEIEAEGQKFNPEIHEAVTQIETDDMEEDMVAAVFQKGYYLHDRVVIAPKVGVSKHK